MADVAALQTKLETLGPLAARPEQRRVAVELLHRRLPDGRAAAGARATAAGAGGVEAGGAALRRSQEQLGAPAPEARQQQVRAGVCRVREKPGNTRGHGDAVVRSQSLSDGVVKRKRVIMIPINPEINLLVLPTRS